MKFLSKFTFMKFCTFKKNFPQQQKSPGCYNFVSPSKVQLENQPKEVSRQETSCRNLQTATNCLSASQVQLQINLKTWQGERQATEIPKLPTLYLYRKLSYKINRKKWQGKGWSRGLKHRSNGQTGPRSWLQWQKTKWEKNQLEAELDWSSWTVELMIMREARWETEKAEAEPKWSGRAVEPSYFIGPDPKSHPDNSHGIKMLETRPLQLFLPLRRIQRNGHPRLFPPLKQLTCSLIYFLLNT